MKVRGRRGKPVSLTAEELETVRNLVYNVLSQGRWPEGLDVPKDVEGDRARLHEVLRKLE